MFTCVFRARSGDEGPVRDEAAVGLSEQQTSYTSSIYIYIYVYYYSTQ